MAVVWLASNGLRACLLHERPIHCRCLCEGTFLAELVCSRESRRHVSVTVSICETRACNEENKEHGQIVEACRANVDALDLTKRKISHSSEH